MIFHVASHFDIGPRDTYEDACAASIIESQVPALPPVLQMVLLDGVGGREAGEIASDIARQTISRHVADAIVAGPTGRDAAAVLADLPAIMAAACAAASHAIAQAAQEDARRRGMATTVVLIVIMADLLHLVWSGDSRAYLLRRGRLHRLTRDHSEVQQLIDAGLIQPQGAPTHPSAHIIYRCLGIPGEPGVEAAVYRILPDDEVWLFSDGATDVLADATLENHLAEARAEGVSLDAQPKLLVDAALGAGTQDNATIICCRYAPLPNGQRVSGKKTLVGGYPFELATVLTTLSPYHKE